MYTQRYTRTCISLWAYACINTQLFFCLKKKHFLPMQEVFSRLDCKVIKASRPGLALRSAATPANCILLPK